VKTQIEQLISNRNIYYQVLNELSNIPKVNFVELYTSDKCPLSCAHCFHGDVRSIDKPLSTNEWQSVIEQLVKLGVRHFHLAGKEPFSDKSTLDLIDYLGIKKKFIDLKFGVITNGLNLKKHLERLRGANLDYLEISIDGLEDTHDDFRGKGTFRISMAGIGDSISVLGDNRVSTATVLSKANSFQIAEMLRILPQNGIRKLFFQPLLPYGSALNLEHLFLTSDEYRQIILESKHILSSLKSRNLGIVVMFHIPSEMLQVVCDGVGWLEKLLSDYLSNKKPIARVGNNYLQFDFSLVDIPFWGHFIITNDGYLIDDCSIRSTNAYVQESIGNIRDSSIEDLVCKSKQIITEFIKRNIPV